MLPWKKTTSPTYFLGLMFLVSVVNYLDRQVLAIVQEDVKADLLFSDSQLGLLTLAFGLSHALFAVPMGRLADRISRMNVLIACLSVWSAMTMAVGAVTNFTQLAAARMGVALGEAGVTPTV